MDTGYIMSCLMWVMVGPGVTLLMLSLSEEWLRGVATGVTGPGLTLCFMSRATRPSRARMSLLRPLNKSTYNIILKLKRKSLQGNLHLCVHC